MSSTAMPVISVYLIVFGSLMKTGFKITITIINAEYMTKINIFHKRLSYIIGS